MQTPYLLIKSDDQKYDTDISLTGRAKLSFYAGDFNFLTFPPNNDIELENFSCRVHQHDSDLYYEDGFMVRYPEVYRKHTKNKLDYFNSPSYEFDGAFSRIKIVDNICTIDGSATYLQTLYSHESSDFKIVSNNIDLIVSFLQTNNITLTTNELFFASHLYNYSLAFYSFAGTPYQEIDVRDSLETISIDERISVELNNKLPTHLYENIDRKTRIELLHERLTHCLDQYCEHLGNDTLGHNVTGGRDSRTSLALFSQHQKEKLKIVTNGHNYTPDKIIAKLISEKFSIKTEFGKPSMTPKHFDYRNIMNRNSLLEVFIPMFRKIHVSTKYSNNMFVANGYLGNVLTFSGSEKNLIMKDNRFDIADIYQSRLDNHFDNIITNLKNVYGSHCYAAFNIMYNTTNKVASVCRRLKLNTYCVFESDLFQMMYFLENPTEKKISSLHYELMKRSNSSLLTDIPFEGNKSFSNQENTFELQVFKEAGNPRLYKKYLERNLADILLHLKKNNAHLPFLNPCFFTKVESFIGSELPALLTNKLYACLGTLEFKGIKYGETLNIETSDEELYTTDFFEKMYVENQLYCSGLSGMVYQKDISFKTYIQLNNNEKFRVVITEKQTNKKFKLQPVLSNSGFVSRFSIPRDGEYTIQMSTFTDQSSKINYLYKGKFIAKLALHDEATSEQDSNPHNKGTSSNKNKQEIAA